MHRILRNLLPAAVVLVSGCGGVTADIVDTTCECEHCNDIEEDALEISVEASRDIAENYGCEAQWDSWADCYLNSGTCIEKDARYTTRELGSCSGSQDTGVPCSITADCPNSDFAQCEGGTCRFKTCADNGNPCQSSEDCPGDDLCEQANRAYFECVDAASSDPTIGGFDLD